MVNSIISQQSRKNYKRVLTNALTSSRQQIPPFLTKCTTKVGGLNLSIHHHAFRNTQIHELVDLKIGHNMHVGHIGPSPYLARLPTHA